MQSTRLKYLKIQQGHEPLLFLLLSDDKVRKYLGGVVAVTQANERVAAMVAHPPLHHWVLQNENAEYIGLIGLGTYYDGKSTELSYSILPKYWHLGYALEAIDYIAQWAFENLQLDHLIAETQCANGASNQLLKKVGFEYMRETVRFDQRQAIYQLNLLDFRYKKT